mmetsp:Transcript_70810/g.198360  ORF Transcript_70810/g.198360 Transcript_70810/m.198360 type:complete len:227 (+) Transcript_70810:1152-1832(+)
MTRSASSFTLARLPSRPRTRPSTRATRATTSCGTPTSSSPLSFSRTRPTDPSRTARGMLVRWSATSTVLSSTAASFCTRPTKRAPRVSCVCCTRAFRWPLSSSRRVALPAQACSRARCSVSSMWFRSTSTTAARSSWAASVTAPRSLLSTIRAWRSHTKHRPRFGVCEESTGVMKGEEGRGGGKGRAKEGLGYRWSLESCSRPTEPWALVDFYAPRQFYDAVFGPF